jgi:hypothetical protein
MAVKQVFNTSAELDFPNVLPTLDLDFANSKTLDPRITFTRSSGGSYVGADGLIKYAGVNEARFDHDPSTGESLGLLVEEARTNLFLRSEEFDNSYWNKTRASIEPNVVTAPDGTLTADKLVEDTTADNNHIVFRGGLSGLASNIYTFSVYVKAAERNEIVLRIDTNVTQRNVRFNLVNGTIVNAGNVTARIENIGNGWYRCINTMNVAEGIINAVLMLTDSIFPSAFHTGDGTSGIYIWGAQLEVGAFPTSYIPTQGSTRTRAADNASITGKNFSEFYNQSEGTIFSEAKGVANIFGGNTRRYWEISRGGSGNDRFLSGYNSSILVRLLVVKDGLTSASITETNQNPFNNSVKVATSFANNYYRLYSNNLYGNPVNSGILPIVNRIDLGGTSNNAGAPQLVLNGTISRLTYFPKRLPNSQLQALTS